MNMADELKHIQARQAGIEAFFKLKGEWVAIFEKLKEMDTPYEEAMIYGRIATGLTGSEPVMDAVDYWCAEVYNELDEGF